MSIRRADELLYDSEATLRLVDNVLGDLYAAEATPAASLPQARMADLPQILMRAHAEINSVLDTLRQSRDMLERTTVEKLQHTQAKLQEVSSAAEIAATDILDGVDRALGLVDRLDAESDAVGSERTAEIRGSLREELFGMMGSLQFQDITSQQLHYASSVLAEMEERLIQLARVFDPKTLGMQPPVPHGVAAPVAAFDPAATTADSEKRQALVDEIFAGDRG